MIPDEIRSALESIASDDDFAGRSNDLVEAWAKAGVGIDALPTILRFMEEHPDVDFGAPGALVHFVERFDDAPYAAALLESVARIPTMHTVWMLNRVLNGTRERAARARLIEAMTRARAHPAATPDVIDELNGFLARSSG